MTPARFAAVALRVACVLRDPLVDHWAAELAASMICPPGYERPTGARLQSAVERQGLPALPTSPGDLLVSEREHILPHVEAALGLRHPLEAIVEQATPSLVAAVDYVASFRGPGAGDRIAADRDATWSLFTEADRRLEPVQRRLYDLFVEFAEPTTAARAPFPRLALVAALIKAGGWPDAEYVVCRVAGFPAINNYCDSGLFRTVEEPQKVRPGEMSNGPHNDGVEGQLVRDFRVAQHDPAKMRALELITRKTRDEVSPPPGSEDPPTAFGPYTREEVVELFGEEPRALHRFAIEQGYDEDGVTIKWRVCDNAKASHTNEMLGVHETISCEDASFPILVAALFARAFGDCPEPLHHATDDIGKAYRRLMCAHPEYSVVAIWDTDIEGVAYYTMYGHNFGLKSAVLSFNRHSQLLSWVARAWFGVPNAAYFDDVDTTEPLYCGKSGKAAIHRLGQLMLTPFSSKKDKAFSPARAFLGVVSDLRGAVQGWAEMRPKPERVEKIVHTCERVCEVGVLPSGLCASLCGKVEYTANSAAFGRVGRAPLAVLREWQHGEGRRSGARISDAVREALQFFVQLLPLLPARRFFFGRKRRRLPPIILYTDAMYDPAKTPAGMVGVVIYDPVDQGRRPEERESKWRYATAGVPPELIAKFRPREQYVGQLEVLAGVAAYTSRPAQFAGRDVIHFIDNTGALVGLAKGYSRDVDSARLISVFHTMNAAVRANVWFEYVPSAANIADLPSRDDLELLHSERFKAEPFPIVWPDVGAWEGKLVELFQKYVGLFGKRKSKRKR